MFLKIEYINKLSDVVIGKIIAFGIFILMIFIISIIYFVFKQEKINSSVVNVNKYNLDLKKIDFEKKYEQKKMVAHENHYKSKNRKFIIIDSKIKKPKRYEEKNEDMLNLYKVNNLIISNKKLTLDLFDDNPIIKEIKNKNNYISLKHIINIENMFLLNMNFKDIESNAIKLNTEITNLIIKVNKEKNIKQKEKEILFEKLYDYFDDRFNIQQKKLLEKYKNEDEDDDIIFIQNNINEIKFLK